MAEALYVRDREGSILERSLDGLTVLYHRPSGITHIVDSPLPEIVAALDDIPVTVCGLRDRLASSFDLGNGYGGNGDDVVAELRHHLDMLVEQGLVRVAG